MQVSGVQESKVHESNITGTDDRIK
jgi:hypothetical protein